MKKFTVMLALLSVSCGSKGMTPQKISMVTKIKSSNDSALQHAYYHIECTASKHQNSDWIELARFKSKNKPTINNGESSQNAEFTSDDGVRFSASGNFDEGLLYFGSIYDFDHRVGTQIQLAKKESLDLHLFRGAFNDAVQYRLHCDMIESPNPKFHD